MATVYVTQAGAGASNGTSLANARSISWFNTNAAGGNTYIFSGAFTSAIIPPASGSLGSEIIVQAHPDNGASIARGSGSQAINFTTARQYWEFDGLTLREGSTAGPLMQLAAGDYTGLVITNCTFESTARDSTVEHIRGTAGVFGAGITITNNTFDDSFYDSVTLVQNATGDLTTVTVTGNTWTSTGRRAFTLDASGAAGALTTVVVSSNNFRDIGTDKGGTWNPSWTNAEAIRLYRSTVTTGPKMTGVVVRSNTLARVGGKGITVHCANGCNADENDIRHVSTGINGQGIGLYGVENFTCNDNVIIDVDSTDADADGHGIDIDAPPDSVDDAVLNCADGEVARNYVRNAKAATFSPGIGLISCLRVRVHHNILVDCAHGIRMTLQSDGTGAPHCEDNTITNNTVIGLDVADSRSGVIWSYAPATQSAAVNSNLVHNNVFVKVGAGLLLELIGPDAATITTPSHNAFWECTDDYRSDDDVGVFSNTTANDVTTDPLLGWNYEPLPSSPLIAAGLFLAYGRDFRGIQSWNPPSIGAFEYRRPRTVR